MKLAFKELWYEKKKYILVECIMVLMIFMVLFLLGLVSGLGRAVSSGIADMDADYFWLSEDSENLITVSDLSPETVQKMQENVTGDYATLDILRVYINPMDSKEKLNITYFAMEPNAFIAPKIVEGRGLSEASGEIVLNTSFREDGIALGDTVSDASSGLPLTVVGFAKNTMYAHIPVGVISVDTYTQIRTSLNEYYKQSFHALAVRGTANAEAIPNTALVSKANIIQDLPGYAAEQMTISMVLWVMVVISAAILGVFFFVLTIQKERQFGVLKAIGVSMKELTGNLVCQMLLLSLFGSLIGNALAFLMASFLPESMPFYLTAENACLVTAAFILTSLLGSLISVIRVAKVDPLTSIGGNA